MKADPSNHHQRWQPVEVQPGEASEPERRRAQCSLANVEVEEQKDSARERQERGDKKDNINKELELIATHALIIGSGGRSRAAEPTNRVPFPTNRSPVDTGRSYFTIRPQAMRSPALPAGSVFMSSALA